MIFDGDWVSLDGNMTADDSLGSLPNGWVFCKDDVYEVAYDYKVSAWGLKLPWPPDDPYNRKYTNHAYSLLLNGDVTVVDKPEDIDPSRTCLECGWFGHASTCSLYEDPRAEEADTLALNVIGPIVVKLRYEGIRRDIRS